jgi:rubredoxin-NAD+ reductase
MKAYMCSVCGYLYDDETAEKNLEGNPIPFEELDDTWECPVCGVKPMLFVPFDSDRTPDVPVS